MGCGGLWVRVLVIGHVRLSVLVGRVGRILPEFGLGFGYIQPRKYT